MDLLVIAQVISIIIGALGGSAGLVMFLTLRQTKGKLVAEAKGLDSAGDKTEAEAVEILARASAGMLSPMEATIASLSRQLAETQAEVEQLKRERRTDRNRIDELEDALAQATRRMDHADHPQHDPI